MFENWLTSLEIRSTTTFPVHDMAFHMNLYDEKIGLKAIEIFSY